MKAARTAMLTGCGGDGSPQPPAVIDKPAVDRVPTRVHQLIVEQLGADEAEVSLDAHLRDDLGADSLDMVELTMALEEEFGREIADAESATFVRVRISTQLP